MSTHVRVSVKFEVDVDPPEGEDPTTYARRCLVAYFNHHPATRIRARGEGWQKIKATIREDRS